jgi:hypothetical protein
MRIPGRLRDTTLGDVLGTLHRAQATGYLELHERSGPVHRIELRNGTVVAIDSPHGPKLGELLELDPVARQAGRTRQGEEWLARGWISEGRLRVALSEQLRQRLEVLFTVSDADLRFHVPRPQVADPTAPAPLSPSEVLRGRPRRRRDAPPAGKRREEVPAGSRSGTERDDALRVLGLADGATRADVQRAFRELARKSHPDGHPGASTTRRVELLREFAALSRAYHLLVG